MAQERVVLPDPTEIAGRYEVLQKLGAGAFGTVYKAKDRLLGRMVAIKTIRLDGLAAAGSGLDELLARFRREAQVSAQLKHPNIVTIYDISGVEGLSYLAMEYIDGPGLDKVISTAGRLPIERAAAIGAQIADALDFAHAHNVVHRDIKPANVMIEAGDRVKVTDFGIAKAIDSGEHLTVSGSLLGTPSYMSPEQARGGAIDGRSDLFSLGCILYEMIAGKKAFRGESITALIFKIITEEPQPITEVDPAIPEAITKIIARALSKAPETRYQTGREFAAALLALTSPSAIPTLRQVEVPTIATPIRPGAATVVQSAAARIAEPTRVPGVRPASVAPRAAPPAAPVPAAGKRSSLAVLAIVAVLFVGFLVVAGAGAWFFFVHRPAAETSTATAAVTPTPLVPAVDAIPEAATATTHTPEVADVTPAPEADRPNNAANVAHTTSLDRPRPTPAPPPATLPSDARGAQTAAVDYSVLDRDVEESPDGRETGQRLAEAYGSGGARGGSYGTQGRFRRRPRSPLPEHPGERPGIRVTRSLMIAQASYRRRAGRYGSLSDLRAVHPQLPAAPGQSAFQYNGYRFEITASANSYSIRAAPLRPGLRSFVADSESDYVTVAEED